MKGTILDYSIQRNDGVITTDDETRYKFSGADWKADSHPDRGQKVDFDVSDGKAVDIYMALPEVNQPIIPPELGAKSKSEVVASVVTRKKISNFKLVSMCLGAGVLCLGVLILIFLCREVRPDIKADMEKYHAQGKISDKEWNEMTADNKITNFEFFNLALSRR